jgi:hypothetical protein
VDEKKVEVKAEPKPQVNQSPPKKNPAKEIKAKVNMVLPSGTSLVVGKKVTLTKEDEAHFQKAFKEDDLKYLYE